MTNLENREDRPLRHFLNADKIREISDLDVLQDEYDDAVKKVEHIRAILEFPPDDADDESEKKTRAALAYGQASIKHLEKRIKSIKSGANNPPKLPKTKTEEEKQNSLLIAIEDRKNSRVKAKLNVIRQVNWSINFVQAAKENLPHDKWKELCGIADRMVMKNIMDIDDSLGDYRDI